MSTVGQIEIEGKETLGHALHDKRLSVPSRQRSYKWEEQQVNDFLRDFADAIANPKSGEYFLGSIVVVKNDQTERPEVVDGQQRLATTTILLAAIRDYFLSNGDTDRGNNIELKYLMSRKLETNEPEPKLILNDFDREYFDSRILSRPGENLRQIKATRESHERINDAANITKAHVEELVKHDGSSKPLFEWIEFLETNARVIWVTAQDASNAYVMFETLNDRGLELSMADLLKNYLLGRGGEEWLSETEKRWLSMATTIENAGNERLVLTYLRHAWISLHGPVRERDVYSAIKSTVHTKSDVRTLAKELAEKANSYAAMLSSTHQFWEQYPEESRRHVEVLNILRVTQVRPLILAVLKRFAPKDVARALRLFISCSVRFLISGGGGGGVMEQAYGERAKEVSKGKISSPTKLRDSLVSVVPTDAEFENSFANARVSLSYLARYYLRALEPDSSNEEWIPNLSTSAVNLEHVLPESLDKWPQIAADIGRAYFRRIGNLALLKTPLNSDAANLPFKGKRKYYDKSDYELTNKLKSYVEWGPEQIEKRQRELAKLAVKRWPVKA